MVSTCCFIGCSQRRKKKTLTSDNDDDHITFHGFPWHRNSALAEKWVQIINRKTADGKSWCPSNYDKVCSLHFKASDFKTIGRDGKELKTKELKIDAFPTILPSDHPEYKEDDDKGQTLTGQHKWFPGSDTFSRSGAMQCSVQGCSVDRSKSPGVTMFKLPKQGFREDWRDKLIEILNKNDKQFNPDTGAICSKHFDEKSFVIGKSGRKRLIPGSLPTLNMGLSTEPSIEEENYEVVLNIDADCPPVCSAPGCGRICMASDRRSDSEGSSDEESHLKRCHPRSFHSCFLDGTFLKKVTLCSDHFKEVHIDRSTKTPYIIEGAFPSRFKTALKRKIKETSPSRFDKRSKKLTDEDILSRQSTTVTSLENSSYNTKVLSDSKKKKLFTKGKNTKMCQHKDLSEDDLSKIQLEYQLLKAELEKLKAGLVEMKKECVKIQEKAGQLGKQVHNVFVSEDFSDRHRDSCTEIIRSVEDFQKMNVTLIDMMRKLSQEKIPKESRHFKRNRIQSNSNVNVGQDEENHNTEMPPELQEKDADEVPSELQENDDKILSNIPEKQEGASQTHTAKGRKRRKPKWLQESDDNLGENGKAENDPQSVEYPESEKKTRTKSAKKKIMSCPMCSKKFVLLTSMTHHLGEHLFYNTFLDKVEIFKDTEIDHKILEQMIPEIETWTNIDLNEHTDSEDNVKTEESRNVLAEESRNVLAEESRNVLAEESRNVLAEESRNVLAEESRNVEQLSLNSQTQKLESQNQDQCHTLVGLQNVVTVLPQPGQSSHVSDDSPKIENLCENLENSTEDGKEQQVRHVQTEKESLSMVISEHDDVLESQTEAVITKSNDQTVKQILENNENISINLSENENLNNSDVSQSHNNTVVRLNVFLNSLLKPKDFPYECSFCGIKFIQRKQLTYHKDTQHKNDKCGYNQSQLVPKSEIPKKTGQLICDQCGKVFIGGRNRFSRYREHLQLHHDECVFQCKICNINFSTSKTLKKHMDNLHTEKSIKAEVRKDMKWICDACGTFKPSSQSLKMHIAQAHTGEKIFKCGICPLRFVTISEYQKHIKSEHNELKKFVCEVCGAGFRRDKDLKRHAYNHYKEKITGEPFKKYNQTIKRQKSDTPNTGRFACKYCGKVQTTRYFNKLHELAHEKGKTFKCDFCDKSYVYVGGLKEHHKKEHAEEITLYECNVCKQRFKRKFNLQVHFRIHTGEKNFECKVCGRRFRQLGDKNRHESRHEKPPLKRREIVGMSKEIIHEVQSHEAQKHEVQYNEVQNYEAQKYEVQYSSVQNHEVQKERQSHEVHEIQLSQEFEPTQVVMVSDQQGKQLSEFKNAEFVLVQEGQQEAHQLSNQLKNAGLDLQLYYSV